jgi:magnesium chelatase family protein
MSGKMLEESVDQLGLSARAHDKVIRLARTIADIDGAEAIVAEHISEAVNYRMLDRKFWT